MTAEGPQTDFSELLDDFVQTQRVWVLPVLRALTELGGKGRPMEVEDRIRSTSAANLNQYQWAHIKRGKHIRWARFDMTKRGLVTAAGVWELTDLGRDMWTHFAGEELTIPDDLPELSQAEAGNVDAELTTMDVTNYDGYDVPILEILSERGLSAKQELTAELGKRLAGDLLPGDRGTLPQGDIVWRYRASWALSNLKKAGELRNPATGSWDISESGKARLALEKATWSLKAFQNSKARVRPPLSNEPLPLPGGNDGTDKGWTLKDWETAKPRLGPNVFDSLSARLRPDLGPTPALTLRPVARNVIFYGPPGTGKTHLARAAAAALTGDKEPGEDKHWQIVQFHPSYSYEDFIQGLRPDLEQQALRYKLVKGPFIEICERATNDPDSFYVLVVDEINRGDPARIFGELLYGLEYRGDAIGLASGGELKVPANLVLLGTMNSVDRSVALVDYALRRRFAFIRVNPDSDIVRALRTDSPHGAIAAELLESFNRWMLGRLGREYLLGHSIFLNATVSLADMASFENVWRLDVAPLLEEYFFGEPDALSEARKEWTHALANARAAALDAEGAEDGTETAN